MMVNFMMQNYLYGRYRWPSIYDLYEYIQTIYLLPAVLSVMANPRKPTFKVTAKSETMDQSRVWNMVTCILSSSAFCCWRGGHGRARVAGTVQGRPDAGDGRVELLNLIIAGCALGVVSERASRRQSHRVRIDRPCRIVVDGEIIDAAVRDVSVGGARLHVAPSSGPNLKKGTHATLEFLPIPASP